MSEDAGNLGVAIRWYDVYLSEAPGGPLAPEAMGRKMVALRNSGQAEPAHKAAELYLARFPGGPYAGVAREILKP
jgi:outer membrane protein assembly factor BamD (BamD/ComL family)